MLLSVIVPARNEEDVLQPCLESLAAQSSNGFALGRDWELLLVDDHSTDRTAELARHVPGVTVLEAGPLQPGWTGKANALWGAAGVARGEWLLFTDADTTHEPGSLERAMREAEQAHAGLLSYSPRQQVSGFWQRALMPLVFAELALAYPPARVSDPASRLAAANGQFLMVRRQAYFAAGGHAAVAHSLLEDVDLARAVKASGRKIFFRYGRDAVRTRMYRNFAQLREGWTKNLALLFPSSLKLAALRSGEFVLIAGGTISAGLFAISGVLLLPILVGGIALTLYSAFLIRIRKAHFSWDANALAIFGLPFFSYLLLRSRFRHRGGNVNWKGRIYRSSSNARMNRAGAGESVSQPIFRPSRARAFPTTFPRLAPWAAFLRRFAAILGSDIPLSKSKVGCCTDSVVPTFSAERRSANHSAPRKEIIRAGTN